MLSIWLALSPIPQLPILPPQQKDSSFIPVKIGTDFCNHFVPETISETPFACAENDSLSEGKSTKGFLPRLKLEYLSSKQTSAGLACGFVSLRLKCCYG